MMLIHVIACLDIQAAIGQRAGVGRYVHHLAEHLAASAAPDELRLFYFDFRRRAARSFAPGATFRVVRWCPGRLMQKAWLTLNAPPYDWLAGRADVYHFPNFLRPPLTRGRSIITVHDVSFVRCPETLEPRNLRYLQAHLPASVKAADAILTDSRFVADELADRFQVPSEKLHPIPLGVDMRRPSDEAVQAARAALRLDRPYLLFVGTIEPRKNLTFLADVFDRLSRFDGDLVLVGRRGWKDGPILARLAASPRAERIRRLETIDDDLLPALYAGAELFVLPSLYEGFGFTPLEAMACGTPVVAAAAGSLPEVLGDAAVLLKEYDAGQWAEAIETLLRDEARRADLRARGLQQAARYTWAETARRTWAVYRELARQPIGRSSS